ncbi:MAG TPA: 4-hydroxythreonine-4-phosphate dehydrogenase PdxA, partial [Saprospiraceae bacterium]|nr:4-hydroxythreonine-4-phosphate dehydrogenase PdxA [Saprospiraceae bacterium]
SPGHGTAFDLAGKNEADPSSYRAAVYLAMDLARNRRSYDEARANALTKKPKLSEDDDSDS